MQISFGTLTGTNTKDQVCCWAAAEFNFANSASSSLISAFLGEGDGGGWQWPGLGGEEEGIVYWYTTITLRDPDQLDEVRE